MLGYSLSFWNLKCLNFFLSFFFFRNIIGKNGTINSAALAPVEINWADIPWRIESDSEAQIWMQMSVSI